MKKYLLIYVLLFITIFMVGCSSNNVKVGESIEINFENYEKYLSLRIEYDIKYGIPYFDNNEYKWLQSKNLYISFYVANDETVKRNNKNYTKYRNETLMIEVEIDQDDIDEYWGSDSKIKLLNLNNRMTVKQRDPNNQSLGGVAINTSIYESFYVNRLGTVNSGGSNRNRSGWKEVKYTVINISGKITREI